MLEALELYTNGMTAQDGMAVQRLVAAERAAAQDVQQHAMQPAPAAGRLAAALRNPGDAGKAEKRPGDESDGRAARAQALTVKEALQTIKAVHTSKAAASKAAAGLVLSPSGKPQSVPGAAAAGQQLGAAPPAAGVSPSPSELAVKAGTAGAVAQHEDEPQWRATGSAWIGRRVRRTYLDKTPDAPRSVDGTVTSWVRAEDSNYVSEKTGLPAALWMVKYDDAAIGEEELEASEVEEALLEHGRQVGTAAQASAAAVAPIAQAMAAGPTGNVPAAVAVNPAGAGESTGAGGEHFAAGEADGSAAAAAAGEDEEGAVEDEEGAAWETTGSSYLKKRVRRKVPVITGGDVWLDATIAGWLPAGLALSLARARSRCFPA